MLGVFYKKSSEYTNSIDPVREYLRILTKYIQTLRGVSGEEALVVAKSVLKKYFKDRELKCYTRDESEDRSYTSTTLMNYIRTRVKSRDILVPTFTAYASSDRVKSVLSMYMDINAKRRGIAKREALKLKDQGRIEEALDKDLEQGRLKIDNNSLSGVFGQSSSVLYNPTAHSTLTSITRTMTSLSNASNEQLVAGNRYLPNSSSVYEHIVYISTYADIVSIEKTCRQYSVYIPTVEDTISVLKSSSDLYFHDDAYYDKYIRVYLSSVCGYTRAAIVYINDLYHLRKYNDTLVREILKSIATPISSSESVNVKDLYSIDEALRIAAHCVNYSKLKGRGTDYSTMDSSVVSSIYHTCLHMQKTIESYSSFFICFFRTDILPSNSFKLKNMLRRVVVLSDTDSTCVALDEWAIWYRGKFIIDDTTIGITALVAYIMSQAIVHKLAIVSKHMNVSTELLGKLAMKNEYVWLAHGAATISKHYYALTAIKEGSIYREEELEIKGVHLKDSSLPKTILEHADSLIRYTLTSIRDNEMVSLDYILKSIIQLEQDIVKGGVKYFKRIRVNNASSYSSTARSSPYRIHLFWLEVMQGKYGSIGEPPYIALKIPTTINSRVKLNEWVASIEDTYLRARLVKSLTLDNKKDLPTVYIHEAYLTNNPLPVEIASIVDYKKLILDMTRPHRTLLETLGMILDPVCTVSEQIRITN